MRNESKKTPDYLWDVLNAVDRMDSKKRMKEDFSKEHAEAVRAIKLANANNGKGYISISKARQILADRYTDAKGKSNRN